MSDIVDAVVAALAVDHGGGVDLSPTGRVRRGLYNAPPGGGLPFAAVGGQAFTGRKGPDHSSWIVDMTVNVQAWAVSASQSLDARTAAAIDLVDRLQTALYAAHDDNANATLYTLPVFELDGGAIDGAEFGNPGMGVFAFLTLRVRYKTTGAL
jgi:hypothetical protein